MSPDSSLKGKRILVTGGAGFIGSHVATSLAGRNEVTVLDDCSLGSPAYLDDSVRFVEGCVLDERLPTDVDVLIHLAGLSSREQVTRSPVRGRRVNVEGFVNTVEQARDAGCDTVVYASTSSVYNDDPPGREDESVTAETRYESTMLSRERYADAVATADISMAGLRFFSVYEGLDGWEAHKGKYANTVSQWAARMRRGERPVLWGDGSQTRDYIHIRDVVRAIETVAANELSGVYNVGTGLSYTFNETVAALNEELGTAIEPRYRPVPLSGYNYRQRADISKLQEATDWVPRIDFREGIRRICSGTIASEV